ncbi:hypothetical protein AAG570_004692 [Ranatra chinensis]|uniref:Uncharacterized protein n=1 Tax=Ranatra chinensis TaxID=642074 RepID=A0ABD0Y1P0_9HEMI
MGVKELWSILSPVCDKKSLWELEGKTLAIDLSCWVCDSSHFAGSQPNTYLRNLFFRTTYLLQLGAKPLFVLEGKAPQLKYKTIRRRLNNDKGEGQQTNGKEGKVIRSRLSALQKQCVELLSCLGVRCITAPGEAEAFCAHLNMKGLACGVVTQDSDVFLYGGTEVYRNFQLSPGYCCDVYRTATIEERLGLTRERMVALSLLLGCDYSEGVGKVGRESALKFVRSVPHGQIFDR